MEAIDEVKSIEWENISEEDWYNARRKNILPRLVYSDLDGNFYHFIPKEKGKWKIS